MKDVIKIFKDSGAIIKGHFIGTSGKHIPTYINKDLVISHPKITSNIGELFANKFKGKNG